MRLDAPWYADAEACSQCFVVLLAIALLHSLQHQSQQQGLLAKLVLEHFDAWL